MSYLRIIIFLNVLLLSAVSCRRDTNVNNKEQEKEVATGFNQVDEQIREVYYRFPSPDEMFSYVKKEDLAFNESIIVPVHHAEQIIDLRKQKVNLGVYVADLAYITIFERFKESTEYLKTIHQLSEDIRIEGAFDKEFIGRIEQNLKNIDSLNTISGEALDKLIQYLVSNDMETTFALVSLGGFVEVMYLSTNMVDNFDPNNPTIKRIAEQKFVVRNLMEYVYAYRDDPAVNETIKEVTPLVQLLNSLPEISSATTVNSKDGKVRLAGGKKVELTEEKYIEIKKTAEKIRNGFLE